MAKETERKFLVSQDSWRDAATGRFALCQFYLATADDRSVRIRIKDSRQAVITLKFGKDAKTRDEFEYALPLADAEAMRAFAIGHVIDKTRHLVPHAGHVFEVDCFEGDLEGLVLAELETPDDVPDADLPCWLGREVTGEPGYYNATLATAGLPEDRE